MIKKLLVIALTFGTIGLNPLYAQVSEVSENSETIVDTMQKGETIVGNKILDVEDVTQIDGGVQVFLRAFQEGQPVGFGKDGTVEFERFRIFNPPVLVPDPNGEIQIEYTDEETGKPAIRAFRYDPAEAVTQVLAHVVSIVGKEGDLIIQGKHGNTTDIYFPILDGQTYRDSLSMGYSSARNNAGTGYENQPTSDRRFVGQRWDSSSATTFVRSIYGFDTSALGSDTVSLAVFSIYGSGYTTPACGTYSGGVTLDYTEPASPSTLANTDYNIAEWAGIAQSDDTFNSGSWSTSGYNDFTLNAAGLANINGSGNTWLGARDSAEMANSDQSSNVGSCGNNEFGPRGYFSGQTGTSQDPILTITHDSGGGGDDGGSATTTDSTGGIISAQTSMLANGFYIFLLSFAVIVFYFRRYVETADKYVAPKR